MIFVIIFVVARQANSSNKCYKGNIFKDGRNVYQFSLPCEDYEAFTTWWKATVEKLAKGEEYKAYDHMITAKYSAEPFEMLC